MLYNSFENCILKLGQIKVVIVRVQVLPDRRSYIYLFIFSNMRKVFYIAKSGLILLYVLPDFR
jgi:hypothetical protein